MTFIEDMHQAVDRLAVFDELCVDAAQLPDAARGLSDQSVGDLLGEVSAALRGLGTLQAVLTGIVAERSTRDRGHGGMAAKGGFRTPVEMIRVMTGVTKSEAVRSVKVGELLLGETPVDVKDDDADLLSDLRADVVVITPWHEPLRSGLLSGSLTQAQADAIRQGLGEPPERSLVALGVDAADRSAADLVEAWRLAAEELAWEAGQWTVEQLRQNARTLRDLLDQEGAQDRLRQQFEARSLRMWRGGDGQRRLEVVFDTEMGEFFESVFGAALRPRRGGPRFMTETERAEADALINDPRSNEQLAYDLFIDVFRSGALADAAQVFGAREPGVRMVVMKDAVTGEDLHRDAFGRLIAVGWTEDGATTLGGAEIERAVCLGGAADVIVSEAGVPLELGRLKRLYNPAQRLALAVRDGGCRWLGCDRPPAYCEAHHCVPWSEGGKTDCDTGIMLCRFHHMSLHNNGWRISAEGNGEFLLHAPVDGSGGVGAGGAEARAPIPLRSKSPLRWFCDPPPDRVGWRQAPVAALPAA